MYYFLNHSLGLLNFILCLAECQLRFHQQKQTCESIDDWSVLFIFCYFLTSILEAALDNFFCFVLIIYILIFIILFLKCKLN